MVKGPADYSTRGRVGHCGPFGQQVVADRCENATPSGVVEASNMIGGVRGRRHRAKPAFEAGCASPQAPPASGAKTPDRSPVPRALSEHAVYQLLKV